MPSFQRLRDLTILRVVQRAILVPSTETVVLVNTCKRVPVLLEASDEIYCHELVTLANGAAQFKPNVSFSGTLRLRK